MSRTPPTRPEPPFVIREVTAEFLWLLDELDDRETVRQTERTRRRITNAILILQFLIVVGSLTVTCIRPQAAKEITALTAVLLSTVYGGQILVTRHYFGTVQTTTRRPKKSKRQ